MKQLEIKGIIPPVVTPMNPEDESVNIPELRNQIERQITAGVHGIFPFGTNGEAYILDMKEKEEILEVTVDQVKGRIPVYAGTGCISTRDTVYLSKRAEALGADALSIITPSFAAASQKELYDHYCEVAKHVNIPIVLYNIPENLKAYIELTRDIGKDFAVLAGNDGNILPCLKAGGAGGVAGRANIWPRTIASIYDHFVAGDLEKAQEAQDAIVALQRVFKFGNPNTIIKKAVAMMGYPVGDCRRPFNYLCDEGVEELKKVLEETKNLG